MGMNIGSNNNLFHSLGYAQGLQQGIESALAANPHAALSMLQGGFGHCATGFGQFSGANLPPFGQMPSPGMMKPVMGPICGGGYSGSGQAGGSYSCCNSQVAILAQCVRCARRWARLCVVGHGREACFAVSRGCSYLLFRLQARRWAHCRVVACAENA